MEAKRVKKLAEELEHSIAEERKIKERDRFETILSLYSDFVSTREIETSVYINKELLVMAVKSYYDDIYRFKLYSHSERADRHKQAAYIIKWISKIKPIQIKEGSKADRRILLINSSFALFIGFSFLSLDISQIITPVFYKHLLYMCHYRNIAGRQLASTLYVLDQTKGCDVK